MNRAPVTNATTSGGYEIWCGNIIGTHWPLVLEMIEMDVWIRCPYHGGFLVNGWFLVNVQHYAFVKSNIVLWPCCPLSLGYQRFENLICIMHCHFFLVMLWNWVADSGNSLIFLCSTKALGEGLLWSTSRLLRTIGCTLEAILSKRNHLFQLLATDGIICCFLPLYAPLYVHMVEVKFNPLYTLKYTLSPKLVFKSLFWLGVQTWDRNAIDCVPGLWIP